MDRIPDENVKVYKDFGRGIGLRIDDLRETFEPDGTVVHMELSRDTGRRCTVSQLLTDERVELGDVPYAALVTLLQTQAITSEVLEDLGAEAVADGLAAKGVDGGEKVHAKAVADLAKLRAFFGDDYAAFVNLNGIRDLAYQEYRDAIMETPSHAGWLRP